MIATDRETTREGMLNDLRSLPANNNVFVFEEIGGREISEDIRILSEDPRRYLIESELDDWDDASPLS